MAGKRKTRSKTTASGNAVTTDSVSGEAASVNADSTSGNTIRKSRRLTKSSSSSADTVNVAADSATGETQSRSMRTMKSSSSTASGDGVNVSADSTSGMTGKKSGKRTDLDKDKSAVGSSAGRKEPKSEAVPMNVDDSDEVSNSKFLGDPIPLEEAKLRWPKRYQEKVFLSCFYTCFKELQRS